MNEHYTYDELYGTLLHKCERNGLKGFEVTIQK
jgi:hypothetical protein